MNNETSSIIDQNEREYEGLIVSLEANQERLNILICVCNQEKLREEIIDRYSKELEPVIPCYRIDLDQKEPSLRAAKINFLVIYNGQGKDCENFPIPLFFG